MAAALGEHCAAQQQEQLLLAAECGVNVVSSTEELLVPELQNPEIAKELPYFAAYLRDMVMPAHIVPPPGKRRCATQRTRRTLGPPVPLAQRPAGPDTAAWPPPPSVPSTNTLPGCGFSQRTTCSSSTGT